MDALVPAFEESLLCPLTDITLDIGELGIDSFMESGVVQQIPILKTIYSVAQVAQNIYDRNLMRQTAQFLMEFNENRISEEKLNKYKNKLSQNPSRREEELSRVLVLLNKNIDLKKSQLEARFFAAYVDEKLTWDEFCELCDITDRLFINDLLLLKKSLRSWRCHRWYGAFVSTRTTYIFRAVDERSKAIWEYNNVKPG